jgi:LPS sulfotransferase NodH
MRKNLMLNDITCLAKNTIKTATNLHRPDGRQNIFLFSTPRSGSTWLMELIWTQPGFKACNEPLDLRNPMVRRYLGITDWLELYNHSANPALHRYFEAICKGRLHAMDPVPFRRSYRPVTHRIVFKIINGGEDRINWFRDTFNGQIVFLIRHPVAVSLSREYYPRTYAQLKSDYQQYFSKDQIDFAQRILENGSKLEQGVLAWCLQNAVPLQVATDDWLIIAYEELVFDPQPVVTQMAKHLVLPEPERMLSRLTIPSAVKGKSNPETQQALEQGTDRRWLAEKWRSQISERDEHRAMEILAHFQIDVYQPGELLPSK